MSRTYVLEGRVITETGGRTYALNGQILTETQGAVGPEEMITLGIGAGGNINNLTLFGLNPNPVVGAGVVGPLINSAMTDTLINKGLIT